MLAHWLRAHCPVDRLRPVRLRLGEVPFPEGLDAPLRDELAALQLPLPSARLKLEPGDRRAEVVNAVLAEEGLALRDLQVRGVRELFFSRGERAALYRPQQLTFQATPDERHPGQHKLLLHFELPRGSYATLLVKAAVGAPDR